MSHHANEPTETSQGDGSFTTRPEGNAAPLPTTIGAYRILPVNTAAWGADHPFGVDNLKDYAKFLRTAGEDAEADRVEARIRKIEGG